uniref:Pre-mRNA 3'-end-processing factor FIP1 n=1 Tax=Elaeophora elaphi TaxID=1147741 RepID=A0A0R3RKV5_9BILA
MSEGALLESEEHYEEPLPPHDEEDSQVGSSEINMAINGDSEQNVKPDTTTSYSQDVDEDELLGDDDDSDDEEVVVTIGQIKQNVPFSAAKAAGSGVGKLDIDGTPTINGEPIYDLDLAQMEERPWRKPGADITDYFNYGFNEETWNSYCERQRKLRSEYGTQASVNKALFSSITLSAPVSQSTTLTGGRQLQTIPILGQEKSSMDLSGFKLEANQQPIIRTVLTGAAPRTVGSGGTSGTSLSVSTVSVLDGTSDGVVAPLAPDNSVPPLTAATSSGTPDFTKAPPDFSKPPPVIDITNAANKSNVSIPTVTTLPSLPVSSDGPPGVDEPAPPGSSTPPPSFTDMNARHIPTVDTSIPPPGFNPMLPPPGIGAPPPVRLGLPNTNVPPPGFSVPPPNFSQPPLNFPPPRFGAPTAPLSRPPPLMSRPTFPPPGLERRELKDDDKDRSDRRERERDRDSADSGEDDYSSSRRRYRRRSRSYSPRSSRRHRDERNRDRDSERYREKDRDRESRSRRHRSRSGSAYESSRSSRRKEDRDNKDKEKRRNKKDESGTRTKEEIAEEKDDEKREGSERKKDDSEKNDREKDKGKDRERKRRIG